MIEKFICPHTGRYGLCNTALGMPITVIIKPRYTSYRQMGNIYILENCSKNGPDAIYNEYYGGVVYCKEVYYAENGIVSFRLHSKMYYMNSEGSYYPWDNRELASLLCHYEDENFWYFEKNFKKNLQSPHYDFQYKRGRTYKFDLDTDPSKSCGCGFNIATKSYLKENNGGTLVLEVKVPKTANVVVPYDLGKVRSDEAILTDRIRGGILSKYANYTWWMYFKYKWLGF